MTATRRSVRLRAAVAAAAAPAATAYGWGLNDTWQVGDSTQETREHPVRVVVPDGVVFQKVVGGDGTSAALTGDGMIYTWGAGGDGAMGNNKLDSRHTPGPVTVPGVTFVDIAIGSGFMLALTDGGIIYYSWGANGDSQLGKGSQGGNHPSPHDDGHAARGHVHRDRRRRQLRPRAGRRRQRLQLGL